MDIANRDAIKEEIQNEISHHKILVYGKGTKTEPRCGFTAAVSQFFTQLDVPFEIQDVLENHEKRQVLAEDFQWPTLPKIFINGEFYGDLDVVNDLIQSGEFKEILLKAFPERAVAQ